VLCHLALPVLVPGPGTANLAISNSAMLTPSHVPVGYPQGRPARRRTGEREVGVEAPQNPLIGIATGPLHDLLFHAAHPAVCLHRSAARRKWSKRWRRANQ
jgi:hypothetical protein